MTAWSVTVSTLRRVTSLSLSGYGGGRSSNASATLNTAVVAPIPIVRLRTETAKNPRLRRKYRTAARMSRAVA